MSGRFSQTPHFLCFRLVLIGALLLTGILSGCSTEPSKEYIPPQGPEAEQCMQYCQAQRFQCRTPLQERARECKARYQYLYRRYEICLAQNRRKVCPRPFPCPAIDYRACSETFEKCFLGCGGRIRYTDDETVN